MTLKELTDTILGSSIADWNKTIRSGLADAHDTVVVYKPEVLISMAWGATQHDDFREPWANVFADKKASSHYLDLQYAGVIADRRTLVLVDGGRCYLPMPTHRETLLVVAIAYANLVRLVDLLSHHESVFDSYFKRADLHEVSGPMPELEM